MATRIETDLEKIDTHLVSVKQRGLVSKISSRSEMFKEETFWIFDSDTNSYNAFVNRGSFWEWAWGASAFKTGINQTYFERLIPAAFGEAAKLWGAKLPFNFIYHTDCPSAVELSNGGRNYSIADDMVSAINFLKPGTAIRINPPQEMSFELNDGSSWGPNGKVLAHSIPLYVRGYNDPKN